MVISLNDNNNIQKNRFKRSIKKPYIKFGDFAICCKNEGRIELNHITKIKKHIKHFIKKKKSEVDVIREKIWYFGRPNFFIQKKSKNSRMGKGKGLIDRRVIIVKQNFILLEFKGVPIIRLKKLIKNLNKFLTVKMYVLTKNLKYFSLWAKKSKYIIYHDKYLFQ